MRELDPFMGPATPSLDGIFRGYVRYLALSSAIQRYLALSGAISRHLAPSRDPFEATTAELLLSFHMIP